jgi:hypothetical protein
MESFGREYFDEHWPTLRGILEQEGPQAMVDAVMARESDGARAALFRFARQGLVFGEWNGKNLDDCLVVIDAGIAWLGQRARQVPAEERTDYLNVLAELTFNVAADLADCWPGDDEPRQRHHFQRGAEIAEQSVGLRDELNKPAASKSLGWWALGYHQLRLDHTDTASDSMERSLEQARVAAREAGEHEGVTPQAPFAVLLGAGYLALARIADDEPSGPDLYAEALAAFRAQLNDPDRKDDAQFGLDQLERVRSLIR